MENDRDREEACIRTAIDQRANALRTGNARVYGHAAIAMRRHRRSRPSGADARGGLETWLSSFEGSVACAVHDLSITTADDQACGHGLLQISGCKTDGRRIDMWVPATFCLRKVDGAWQVTNERTPLPFHTDHGAAEVEREPCAHART